MPKQLIETTSRVLAATVAVSVSPAYTAGDLVGGKLEWENLLGDSLTGVLQSLVLRDQSMQNVEMDLFLFDSDPSASTFTDNGAFDIADADLEKVIGCIAIVADDYCNAADNSVAVKAGIGLVLQLQGTTRKLYGALVTRGTPTYVATTDVSISLGALRDN